MDDQVWLITGCSSGFGKGLAERCIALGYRVAATARRPETVAALVALAPDRVIAPALDVANPVQVENAIKETLEKFGRIDVLVNNAGYAQLGIVETVTDAESRAIFDVNFFGVLAVTRAVLPSMRAKRSGLIINVTSAAAMGGRVAFGMYCASKMAIEGATESLTQEVEQFGISVMMVEPGAFKTNLTPAAQIVTTEGDYAPILASVQATVEQYAPYFADPALVVEGIFRAIEQKPLPKRIMLGEDSLQTARERSQVIAEQVAASTVAWAELNAAMPSSTGLVDSI